MARDQAGAADESQTAGYFDLFTEHLRYPEKWQRTTMLDHNTMSERVECFTITINSKSELQIKWKFSI